MDNWVLAAIFLGGTLWVTEVSAEDAERRIIADLYVDMEAGALGDVITTNLLDKMTHGTGGTWGLKCGRFGAPHEALKEFTVSSHEVRLPTPVSVGGITYKDTAGTRGWACEMLTPVRAVAYTFSVDHPSVSVGFFMEYHATKHWTPIDLVAINARNGDFVVMNTTEHPRNLGLRVHTGDHWEPGGKKGSKVGIAIPLEDGKLYWVSMRFVQHGESSLALFAPVTFRQIGLTSTLTLTSDSPAHNLVIGRVDDHGITSPATIYWDNLIVDWSHAVFPLLP